MQHYFNNESIHGPMHVVCGSRKERMSKEELFAASPECLLRLNNLAFGFPSAFPDHPSKVKQYRRVLGDKVVQCGCHRCPVLMLGPMPTTCLSAVLKYQRTLAASLLCTSNFHEKLPGQSWIDPLASTAPMASLPPPPPPFLFWLNVCPPRYAG